MKTKKCNKCNNIKPISDFPKWRNQCKKCKNEQAREKRKQNPKPKKLKEILSEGYKRCSNLDCNEVKLLSEFGNTKYNKINGKTSKCKKCINKEKKQWNKKNPDKVKINRKNHYENNRDKILEKNKTEERRKTKREWAKKHRANMTQKERDEINKERRKQYQENPEKPRKRSREWTQRNKEKRNRKNRERTREDKDKTNKRRREKYLENIKENRKKKNNYNKNNPHIGSWRKLILHTLDKFGTKKEEKTIDLLGYTSLNLKNYILSLFTEGMNWEENYGKLKNGDYGWSIDHIIGTNNFKTDTPPQIVNELDNLQPLWMIDKTINGITYMGNFSKCDKILIEDEKSRYLYKKYKNYLKDEVIEKYDKKLLLLE